MTKEVLLKGRQLITDDIQVFPLVSNSKIPLKGTSGYLGASNDKQNVDKWFDNDLQNNLGMRLDTSGLLVVDIDEHGSIDGIATLRKLHTAGKSLPSDTYIEKTPHGGLHYFFSANNIPKTRKVALYAGIDVLTDFVVVAPSLINGQAYQAIDKSAKIQPAPKWLLADLKKDSSISTETSRATIYKTWTGQMLDELVSGTDQGNRNSFMTSLLGKILRTGCDGATAYDLLQYANEKLQPPLESKEVNTIFRSIIKRI